MTEREPVLIPSRIARGSRGAVVAPHHLATNVGLGVLASGGHAVDAAIATNAALAVVEPNGCGIGGDAFWLVWDEARGEQVGLNGSGRAPSGADPGALRARGLTRLPLRGPYGVTVPGAVRSWSDAHRRFGRLPLDRVLGPAIELAERGFAAWGGFIDAVERTAASVGDAHWARGFHAVYRPNGRAWREGELVRLPALTATLRRLADQGLDAFYEGDIGERQAAALRDAGAPCSVADFAGHRSTWTTPIGTSYRGTRVTTHPPNSAGIVALEILNILETFGPPSADRYGAAGWNDARWIHLGLEASKLALADRDACLTDPEAREVPVGRLTDKAYAASLASRIDERVADVTPTPCRTLVGGTIYLAAVDADGNAVSLIESNAAGFGSGIVDPVTGIHYQNRGASFSLDPDHPNVLAPGKRTAHSLMPGMLFREGEARPWVVAGSMGGDIQPQIHAQLVSALVDGRADIAMSVSAPRWSVEADGYLAPPTLVSVERRLAPDAETNLAEMGHSITRGAAFDSNFGHCHAIQLVNGGPAAGGGSLAAVTDPRSWGLPAVR